MTLSSNSKSLSWKNLLLCALAFGALVFILHSLCLHFYPKEQLDIADLSDFWPMSVFRFRVPHGWNFAWAGAAVLFYTVLRKPLQKAGWAWQFWGAFILTVLASMTHGWQFGLDYPTAGWGEGGIEYYQDAVLIKNPIWFFLNFNSLQPVLQLHSQVHPPGPVLLYWLLAVILRAPALISLAVSLIALAISLSAWRRLLALVGLPQEKKPGLTLLYSVLPGVSIYYLAVVDAIQAGVLAWALVEFLDDESAFSKTRCVLWLFAASMFNFGFIFIFPVLTGLVLWGGRSSIRLIKVCLALAGIWILFWWLAGFNYPKSFLTALTIHRDGFINNTLRTYIWYRLGSVLEITVFMTPFIVFLIPQGLRAAIKRAPLARTLFWLGAASVAGMLLGGAMNNGEAARYCLFLVPYLLLPVAVYLSQDDTGETGRLRVTDCVFGMGLMMQLLGFYQW